MRSENASGILHRVEPGRLIGGEGTFSEFTEYPLAMRIDTKKWVVLVTVFTLTMVAGDHFIRFNLILPGFAELELRQLAMNLARSKGAIEREVLHVQTLTTDWAQWDDMYTFASQSPFNRVSIGHGWKSPFLPTTPPPCSVAVAPAIPEYGAFSKMNK